MVTFAYEALGKADLHVDAIYEGRRRGNAGDDPFPALLGMSNQGGFRYRGDLSRRLEMLLLLTGGTPDPDWPDLLDPETGIFTYYGDNKQPGLPLHETKRRGNLILRKLFDDAHGDQNGRTNVPPILLFARTGNWRDVVFLGLAVPGAADLSKAEDLVAIWRSVGGRRFQNYRARFTVLDAPLVSRRWIDGIIAGNPDDSDAPAAWTSWKRAGTRRALVATRTTEFRTRAEQLPHDRDGEMLIETLLEHFRGNPHRFEHCAAAIAKMAMPAIASLDVTRPARDGGRDGIGQLRIGLGPGSILVDFALEAKCYSRTNSVGVREISRLISRLRHRQFGIIVTTSCVDIQTYREIKEDGHPIVVIAATDIVALLHDQGIGTPERVRSWLIEEFPDEMVRS